ncbi:hypothetical protein [Botryobacter ruber]|uniref:hypothetical protein n=1 Tax=Botryobacter ruber TaxID=2171629 RepID=UPI000E0BCA92|nr:hypothetical protein [Botryobacter ruber]
MNYIAFKFWIVLLLLLAATGCMEREAPVPLLQADEVLQAITGKWTIEKIDYQLCRDRNCTVSTYTGSTGDYFEFRADSAFLVLTERPQQQQKEQFKASYTLQGSVVLTKGEWSGRFELEEAKAKRLVLRNTFIGRDPNAIFTDTYYLTR